MPVVDADVENVAAAASYTPDSTTKLTLDHALLRARGLGALNPEGTLVAKATLPGDPNGDSDVAASYDGHVGEIPVRATASLQGKRVNAVVDVPETAGAAINPLAPGTLHVGAPVSAHAEAHGELPVVEPHLEAHIGEGRVTASAIVTLPEKPRTALKASLSLGAKDIDLSAIIEGAPKSSLSAGLEVTAISRPEGKLSGTFHLTTDVGEAAGQVVPAASVAGDFTRSSMKGVAHIEERGAPTEVHFSLAARPGSESPDQLAFRVSSTIADLDAVARAGRLGRGRGRVVAEGRADLQAKTFLAKATVEVSGLEMSGVKVGRAVVTASGDGPFDAPQLTAKVVGTGAIAGGYLFSSVTAIAKGTLAGLDVAADLEGDKDAPAIGLSARLTHGTDLLITRTRVRLARKEVKVTATVDSIRVGGGTVDIRGLAASGLGAPLAASARIWAGGFAVKTKATDIDLSHVATLLAKEEDAKGHLSFDVDAVATRAAVNGTVDLHARDVSARGIDGASLDLTTAVHGRSLDGRISAKLGAAGEIDLTASKVVLGGAATDLRAWRTAAGSIALDGNVDLEKLVDRIPASSRPVQSAAGVVTLKGVASRPAGSGAPTIAVDASTKGLRVVAKRGRTTSADGIVTLGPPPFSLDGYDGVVALKLAPTTGATEVKLEVRDAHGPAVTLDAGATLPLKALLARPDNLLALLGSLPLTGKIEVPRRSLDSLPPALGKPPVKGDVELVADLSGTPRAPRLAATAKGTKLLARDAPDCVPPLDVQVKLAYDGTKATVQLTGSRDSAQILSADAAVKISSADAVDHGTLAWDASSKVTLTRFPLDAVAPLLERNVSGELSGSLTVSDLHRAASVDGEFDVRALALDRAAFPKGRLALKVKDGALLASVRLDQSDGYLETKATGAVVWGAELAPRLDLAKAMDVSVKASNFRANAAMPFVEGTFSELDGRLDTDAQVHILGGGKDGNVKGAITLRDGSFEVPQLGERFHALKGNIVMNPWGTLKFQDFAADGPSGHLSLSGDAVLKGLTLQKASAHLQIEKGHSIPIALEGVSMGRAYGDVKVTANMAPDGKRVDVGVDVAMLRVDLPQSTGHSVQALEHDKAIRVGLHTEGGEFVTVPLVAPEKPRPPSDMVIHAAINLGRETQVKRDTTVDVTANGKLDVLVTDKAHVTGKINVERGRLELEGKVFTVDHATVSFLGDDPSNPMVIATAYWDAPDATRVYADFSGLVSQGNLKLRSEPTLSQDEILSLILFGSADGSFGAQPPPGQEESTGAKAAGMAGGVITQGLDKAISGITTADISTRVDTSEADNPRPELAVQITKTVSARLGYKLGVPAPGENPDRTELTLDWRFIRNWSLVAVVGDQGSTALDVVWRMRY